LVFQYVQYMNNCVLYYVTLHHLLGIRGISHQDAHNPSAGHQPAIIIMLIMLGFERIKRQTFVKTEDRKADFQIEKQTFR